MASLFTVEHNGVQYVWDGHFWFHAREYTIPDLGLISRLDELLPQGQRPLTCCAGKDFQQEVVVPSATAAFADDAVAAGVLFEQR